MKNIFKNLNPYNQKDFSEKWYTIGITVGIFAGITIGYFISSK